MNKKRQAYIKRVIVHTAFHNVSYAEAAKMLEPMKQGEAIVRPSSKGTDRLTITWKVTDDVLHHIDVREDEKKFVFSLGKRLFIDKEEFEDLDEILARYVNPMAAYASELLECHYYKPEVDGIEEKANEIMKEQKKANPARIPCILSASKVQILSNNNVALPLFRALSVFCRLLDDFNALGWFSEIPKQISAFLHATGTMRPRVYFRIAERSAIQRPYIRESRRTVQLVQETFQGSTACA